MDSRWEGISSDEFSDCVEDTSTHSDAEVGRMKPTRKRKMGEQATPHRVIEKRRRDRINRSLDELRVMVPAARKAQGVKNDKVDLLQMTIEYLKSLQQPSPRQQGSIHSRECDTSHRESEKENDENSSTSSLARNSSEKNKDFEHDLSPNDVMLAGFKECAEEAIRFLIEVEQLSPDDPLVLRLSAHLKKLQNNLEFNTAMEEHTKIFSFAGSDAPLIPSHDFFKKSYQASSHSSLHTPQSSPPLRTVPATTLGELRIDTTPLCTMASGLPISQRVPVPAITPSVQVNGIVSPASSTSSGLSPTSLTPLYAYVPRYAYTVMPQMYLASPPLGTSPVPHPHSPAVAVGSASGSNQPPYVMTWLPPNGQ